MVTPDLSYVLEHINKVSQAQADAIFNPEKEPIDPAKIDPFHISEIYRTTNSNSIAGDFNRPKEEPAFDFAAMLEKAQKEAMEMARKIYKDEF